ncbi:MAG: DUF4214 domain-containing protein [Bacteroides sp.]|nr:DUF4214 domain-containing protein [Bacteroides sp.]MCM1548458.1 DUF4214 domain-containing protein [Clostridium sp.]
MKKTWKRLFAIGTALVMLGSLPGIPVFAGGVEENSAGIMVAAGAEDTTEGLEGVPETEGNTETVSTETVARILETEENAEVCSTAVTEEEPAAENDTEEPDFAAEEASVPVILNYVYIENTEISRGVEQIIAVNIEGLEAFTEQIQGIRLGYQINGREETIGYSEIDENLVVFRQGFVEIGTYELAYMEIQGPEQTDRVVFADWEVSASFLVEEGEEGWDEPMVVDGMPLSVTGGDMAELMTEVFPQNAGDGKVVVVLDPGHDGKHCGAAGNGLREEELTLRIAQYCKEELEQYRNVTVYMTRNDGSCPDPRGNGYCMKTRCNYAASVGADLLVSIHIDAGSLTRSGAMVIVAKNGIYRDDLSTKTHAVGEKILEELTKLGLASRGLYVRMSDSPDEEYHYPNGAVADWYAITRDSIKVGVPGIIVEHCFISNPSDVANFLSSEEKLKNLGVADATGIARYFNLSKRSAVTEAMLEDSTELYTDTEENIPGFVASLYRSVLNRTPSRSEVSWWVAKVDNEGLTGLALTKHFVNSQEFQNKAYTDEEYVEKLYEIFLGRPSDTSGKSYWVSLLKAGTSRVRVAEMIGNCPEFEIVCARYGIAQGSHSMEYAKLYPKIVEFTTRYYNGLMNRKPDKEGLEYWTKSIILGERTAADLTRGFINSPEFRNQNISKDDFVEGLYQIYLGRPSDPEGKAYWTGRLGTMSQQEKTTVIRGFIRSEEYRNYCDSYGITVGDF